MNGRRNSQPNQAPSRAYHESNWNSFEAKSTWAATKMTSFETDVGISLRRRTNAKGLVDVKTVSSVT
jgi:hypothetical protein